MPNYLLEILLPAMLIAATIGLASAIISPFLVLNEQALIADGLAHVGFTGLVIGLLFSNQPLFISIPFVVLAAIFVKYLSQKKNLNGDAALGIVSTLALAIGFIIIYKSPGFNTSIEGMLVGNIWTVTNLEIILAIITLVFIIGFVVFYYRDLVLMTYDYKFARFKGVKTTFLSYTLAALTAVLITVGVKTIGTLLISSLIIFPVLIGMQFKTSFKNTIMIGGIFSVIAVITGIISAHYLDVPAGSNIVVIYAIILLGIMVFNKLVKKGSGYRD